MKYSIKIINSEGNDRKIELGENDRVILQIDNIIIDVEQQFDEARVNLYPWRTDKKFTGIIHNEITA